MIYFLDTEFNGFGGALISLALVAADGTSLYLVREDMDALTIEPWVKDNVLPMLDMVTPEIMPYAKFGRAIANFIGTDENPIIIADWPEDFRHLSQALLTGPGTMVNIDKLTMQLAPQAVRLIEPIQLKGAIAHNAWWDAMALREYYRQQTNAGDRK